MLSAVSHRFENKSKLYTWGREERDNKWNTMLSFAPYDEMKSETTYFQRQNISFRMDVLERDYKDILILEPLDITAKKVHRVRDCFKEASALHEWCSNGICRIETILKEVHQVSKSLRISGENSTEQMHLWLCKKLKSVSVT